ncbi:MAG: MFS transporter [Thermofilaceae archaeon]|nr:MFS transporter [Thermofilaceae archaeon]MDW8004092.1 MFS transporter [Thermofilaceae archaeon]
MLLKGRLQKLVYGLGNFGKGFFYYSVGAYLSFFYVDVLGLKPEYLAWALSIPYGLWNAVNDPLIGVLSDRLRTRWGRRVPLIAFGALLTALCFWLIWSPHVLISEFSQQSLFIFLVIVLASFDLSLTAVTSGYEALFPEMFEDLAERSEASLYREMFALLGVISGFAVFPLLKSALSSSAGELGAWSQASLILCSVSLATILVSLLACREKNWSLTAGNQPSLIEAFKLTLTNKAYLAFLGADVVVFFLWSWIPSMIPFFVKYVLMGGDEVNALMLGAMLLSAIAWWPLLRKFTLKTGSKTTFMVSAAVFVLSLQPLLFTSTLEQVLVLMFLVGAGNAGLQLVRMICLSNVIDEEWLKKGYRREGAYIGTMIFFERLMYIVQGWLLALLLNAFGYVPNVPQTPSVAFGIRVSVTLIPLATLLFLLVSMTFYPIGRREEQLIAAKRKGVEG